MKRSLMGWMLLCILSTAHPSFAQIATTSLRGTIKDPTGALVPGAKITITDKATGKSHFHVADSSGAYQLSADPPVQIHHHRDRAGFGDQTKTAELLVNQPATIDFALTVQASTVTVDVSARRPDPQYLRRLARQLRGQCADPGAAQRDPQRARPAFPAARRALPAPTASR